MSKVRYNQQEGGLKSEQNEPPAVGIVATGEDANEVAGAILRAREHDCEPIVAVSDSDSETFRFANQLDVTIVTGGSQASSARQSWDELAAIARKNGYPGLLRHTDLSLAIDYEESIESLSDASTYAVSPVHQPRVQGQPEVLVAIPAYNEGETIADVVAQSKQYADQVVVIDDGSSDDTVSEARSAGATVIVHEVNKGYGGALKTAFSEAERSGASHLVILDGDGQHDPKDIPELVAHQQTHEAAIVIGSRFEQGSETDLPLYRRVGLRVVNALTNLSLGVVRKRSRIEDTQSGFRAYNRQAIESLANDEDVGDRMGASTDILYHAHKNGYEVKEVGTTIDYDVDNASSHNPISHGLHLVNNILRTVERERPVTVLGVPGFVSTVVGIGFGYWTFSNYLSSGTFPLGLAIVSVFFALAGIFSSFTGIILHSLEMHLKS
ncbi:dolichyl-phosphate beta-D-mannosyltransferase [Haloferax larsenii JCM 13917]|nr:glycosyltransferase family 2 protein [Haloferax larsenii]ELZ77940.1 dolichyl-phosphate beta-D-mannosyltransferase [Haloferax larsenii JCM 13917]